MSRVDDKTGPRRTIDLHVSLSAYYWLTSPIYRDSLRVERSA